MQKFHKDDLVHIAADLGPSMSHFESDVDAIVKYSYAEKYDGGTADEDGHEYCLYVKGHGEVSWYHEEQLTLLEHRRGDLLKQWKNEQRAENRQHGDLDWIFAHGNEVLKSASGATVTALAKCLDPNINLWGSRGEGFTYYSNAMFILQIARPYLAASNKDGWLAFCAAQSAAQKGKVAL